MLEPPVTRDPLALHLAFAKRQPFIIAGFLDSTEFAMLVDFVPHLAVHDTLDKMGMGKRDGSAMLAQLLDSEQEDLVEGQKNVIAIHNAGPDDLDLLAAGFKQAWFASTVLPAADVVKKYHVPVYDARAAAWANIHPDGHGTLWARSILDAHGTDATALRMALKGIYLDACQLAAALLAGDVAGKASSILHKYDDASTKDALVEAATAYFGINARELLQDAAIPASTSPSSPSPPGGIEHPVTLPADLHATLVSPPPKVVSPPSKVVSTAPSKASLPGSDGGAAPRDPFTSEYYFLSKNATFKKALVKVVGDTAVPGAPGFTSPAAKYAFLRREGAWTGELPPAALRAVLGAIVAGCKDKAEALAGAKAFQSTATAFKLASAATLATIIPDVLAHAALPDARPGKAPLVGGRSWPGMDAPPGEINALVTWLGQGLEKLRGFAASSRRIARQRGLLGAGVDAFVPVPLPSALDKMRGGELVPWLHEAITALQAWTRQLGAPPVAPAPADAPRALAIMDAAWREAGEKLAAGDLEGFVQKAFLSME
ncbi:MAG: hypothetical protein GYA36_17475, partial [Veillonellaceae bacterium]|nr:hypothetical protein [Veillonellaceae bacterium]